MPIYINPPEILTEARIRNTKHNIHIGFDVTTTYIDAMKNDPYFKVYNAMKNPSKECRISFRRAEFVEHTNKSKKGLPQFHIDSDTRDRMIAYFLDGGWEETLAEFNMHIKQQLGSTVEANSYNFYCEMPNYMELSPLDKRFSKK